MPKHYCDYCDCLLTHDSQSARKSHNNGRNHLQNVADWYAKFTNQDTQDMIDAITRQFEGGGPPAGYNRPSGFNRPPQGNWMPPPRSWGPPGGFPNGPPPLPPGGGPPFAPNLNRGGPSPGAGAVGGPPLSSKGFSPPQKNSMDGPSQSAGRADGRRPSDQDDRRPFQPNGVGKFPANSRNGPHRGANGPPSSYQANGSRYAPYPKPDTRPSGPSRGKYHEGRY